MDVYEVLSRRRIINANFKYLISMKDGFYDSGVWKDSKVFHKTSFYIKSIETKPNNFGTRTLIAMGKKCRSLVMSVNGRGWLRATSILAT